MRRERSAAKVRLVLLVALASLLYVVGRPELGTGAAANATLPHCLPEGYGLKAMPVFPAGQRPNTVRLTVGWLTAKERRHPCRLRTTIRLTIVGSSGVPVSALWNANTELKPWSAVVHTWVWRNWCEAEGGPVTV